MTSAGAFEAMLLLAAISLLLAVRGSTRHIFAEAIQRLTPSPNMLVANEDGFERRLMDGEPSLAAEIFEVHRDQRFMAGVAAFIGPAAGRLALGKILEGVGEDDSLGLDDFAKYPALAIFDPGGRAHRQSPCTADPKIDRAGQAGKTLRPPPSHHVLRRGPGFEDEAAGRIENAREGEFAVRRRLIHGVASCGHFFSPVPFGLPEPGADRPQGDPGSAPRNGDNVRSIWRRP